MARGVRRARTRDLWPESWERRTGTDETRRARARLAGAGVSGRRGGGLREVGMAAARLRSVGSGRTAIEGAGFGWFPRWGGRRAPQSGGGRIPRGSGWVEVHVAGSVRAREAGGGSDGGRAGRFGDRLWERVGGSLGRAFGMDRELRVVVLLVGIPSEDLEPFHGRGGRVDLFCRDRPTTDVALLPGVEQVQ